MVKPLEEFYEHAEMRDGRLNKCIDCVVAYAASKYQALSKEERRIRSELSRKAAPDARKKHVLDWSRNNPGKVNAQTAKRRAIKKLATPKWLTKDDLAAIGEFYIIAKDLAWLSEERLEVDHIIPLVSDIVSGLHVPWNLQILPKSLNVRKSNKVAA